MELTFRNPFKVSLSLLNLSLLWEFTPNDAAPSEEKLPQPLAISNEECLAQKVRGQCVCFMLEMIFYSVGLMEDPEKQAEVTFCLSALQSTQESDTISTEVILEFHLGPEETKTVQCFHHTESTE